MGKVESESRLEFLLLNWADWMRRGGSVARGYPSKSCGFTEYGANSIQDMEDSSDSWLASAVDAIVRGLPDEENNAIHHQYLDSRYRYRVVFYAPTLRRARELVQAGMDRKGIW